LEACNFDLEEKIEREERERRGTWRCKKIWNERKSVS